MTKKYIEVKSKNQDIDLDRVDDVIHTLNVLKAEFGGDAMLYFNNRWEGDVSFYVASNRLETDEEYAKRLENEKKHKEASERNERETYERLKAKYGS